MSKKLMRKKLALMLANLKKKRKYYCEVEYLESSGTQYIDTGIPNKEDLTYQVTAAITSYASDYPLCGVVGATQYSCQRVLVYNNSIGIQRGVYGGFPISISYDNNFHTYYSSPTKLKIDNNELSYSRAFSGDLGSNTFFLFAYTNVNGTIKYSQPAKLSRAIFYDTNGIIMDMIPVLDWNMTPCMYDRVTEQLFYNAGTGDFVAGRQIHPVEYLESTGVEYIDTGIKFDGANTKIELKTYEDSLTRKHSICGDNGNFFYYFRGSGNWAVGYDGTGANIDLYMSVGDNVFVMDKNNVYVNGVLAKTYTLSSNVSAYNTLLFNRKTSLLDKGAVTMYYCKIWNNSALVRDFIPMIDEQGVGAMFDRVTHTIYDNAGTGAFAYPPVELEYLESSGTEYIDLGVGVKSNTVFKATFSVASTATGRSYFGARNSSNERFQIVNSIGIGAGYYLVSSIYPIANQKYEIEMHASGEMYLDGVKRNATNGTFSQVSFERNIWLFATNYYDSSVPPGASTFWKAQVLEGDTLVRDFIPVFKDGQAGMWDKVNSVFYPNAGTGVLVGGAIVEPEYE